MAHYAVGDIQGCLDALQRLLEKAQFSEQDTLWCAGDLINRGPQSLETLRFIKNMGTRAVIVLGNHDLHLLACWYGARQPTRKDTFDEILTASDAAELIEWLRQQPLLHHDATLGYTMTHAGIPPIWTLSQARGYAKEVEAVLHCEQPEHFFHNMYGNIPDIWDEQLTGNTRLRVITNYLTRMRFCTSEGRLDFEAKDEPQYAPEGYAPWFSFDEHLCRTERLIFGHWAALMGKTGQDQFIGLDTGCVWGGQLTLLKLENRECICIDC